MRPLLLKACALALTLGIVVFVVQASRLRAREPDATAAPLPSASASAGVEDGGAAAVSPSTTSNQYGVIGPATKADPHVMRRAVESLQPAPKGSAVAP
jgi:hypothetical protein